MKQDTKVFFPWGMGRAKMSKEPTVFIKISMQDQNMKEY